MMTYDSKMDTLNHIARVRELIYEACSNFERRAYVHDDSKLVEPEKSAFDIATPKLKELEYNSDEYKASLAELGVALQHHYAHNRHHPEHYSDGIRGMSLFDILEMLLDWAAAVERHKTGNLWRSLEINRERFGIDDQLFSILANTIRELNLAPMVDDAGTKVQVMYQQAGRR